MGVGAAAAAACRGAVCEPAWREGGGMLDALFVGSASVVTCNAVCSGTVALVCLPATRHHNGAASTDALEAVRVDNHQG
jgi:hypothetical protein